MKLLVRRGALVGGRAGRYYLDDAGYEPWRRWRRSVLTAVLVVLALLGLVLALLGSGVFQ